MHSRTLNVVATAAALAALAVPAGAVAKGGNGGGTAPAPVSGPCATIVALNSGVVDKPASNKPIVLDFQVTNCSADRTQTLSTSLVGTAVTVRSVDPYVIDTCAGLPFAAPQITLAPRASRKISVQPRYPFCGRAQWGVDGYDINYDVTTSDAAGGPVLATTTSSVLRRGGV